MATSPAIEEYLQAIYTLADEGTSVIGARLAAFMGVSAAACPERRDGRRSRSSRSSAGAARRSSGFRTSSSTSPASSSTWTRKAYGRAFASASSSPRGRPCGSRSTGPCAPYARTARRRSGSEHERADDLLAGGRELLARTRAGPARGRRIGNDEGPGGRERAQGGPCVPRAARDPRRLRRALEGSRPGHVRREATPGRSRRAGGRRGTRGARATRLPSPDGGEPLRADRARPRPLARRARAQTDRDDVERARGARAHHGKRSRIPREARALAGRSLQYLAGGPPDGLPALHRDGPRRDRARSHGHGATVDDAEGHAPHPRARVRAPRADQGDRRRARSGPPAGVARLTAARGRGTRARVRGTPPGTC